MTGWAGVLPAAVLAGLAAALCLRPASSTSRRPAVAVALVMLVWAVGSLSPDPRHLLVLVVTSAALSGGVLLVRRRRQRLAARRRAGQLLEACGVLASELTAGQPPGAALHRAQRVWPGLAPVLRSHDLGADVPDAWRFVSRKAGAHDALLVAAAWQVSHRSGVGLGDALGRVAAGLRASGATRRVVESELASARATARLLAALPVLALLVGGGAVPGSSPWGFLLGTPIGLACLGVGLGLGFAGLWWIESIADDVERRC
ncbi:type II secretion system protein [Nocardioides sp. InS609-2]|uniref:type II secretion system F family protein n=1 Tax=Nocardioides sp. InS609-2 TaxID=2760705 RepID=UPI0020BECF34|nr:type II secretion system protein [Nocardioides sp. InS609-2]